MHEELIMRPGEAPDDWHDAKLHHEAADAVEKLLGKNGVAPARAEGENMKRRTSPCYSCANKNVYDTKHDYYGCKYSGTECNNYQMWRPKEMKCEYCHTDLEGYIVPLDKNAHVYLHSENRYHWMLCIKACGWRKDVPINFCPMCGRKLGEKEDVGA